MYICYHDACKNKPTKSTMTNGLCTGSGTGKVDGMNSRKSPVQLVLSRGPQKAGNADSTTTLMLVMAQKIISCIFRRDTAEGNDFNERLLVCVPFTSKANNCCARKHDSINPAATIENTLRHIIIAAD